MRRRHRIFGLSEPAAAAAMVADPARAMRYVRLRQRRIRWQSAAALAAISITAGIAALAVVAAFDLIMLVLLP